MIAMRRARADDLPALVALLADDPLDQAREDTSLPLNVAYTTAFAAIDADPHQLLAVAERQGNIVGCLQLTFLPGLSRLGAWRGQIESVRVARTARGQGLGRQMFEWAIAECRARNCTLVQLTSDSTRPEAHRFYTDLGFAASHVGFKLTL
jgi:ribosomal protein S18 acetylase RimI-like enzyme